MIENYFKTAWKNLVRNKVYSIINIAGLGRINISIWMFVIATLVVAVIALCTVSFQAIKAAIANPVKSLRTE